MVANEKLILVLPDPIFQRMMKIDTSTYRVSCLLNLGNHFFLHTDGYQHDHQTHQFVSSLYIAG